MGGACHIKMYIDGYLSEGQKTQFFDWLIEPFESVITLLETDNIQILLNEDTIELSNNNTAIYVKQPLYLLSIHDTIYDRLEDTKKYFIEKYLRRYDRLIQTIKTSDEPIYFIRGVPNVSGTKIELISTELQNKFINLIKKLNPKLEFKLIILHLTTGNKNYDIINNNIIIFNYLNYEIPNIPYEPNQISYRRNEFIEDLKKSIIMS
jgi:hypothetical protein